MPANSRWDFNSGFKGLIVNKWRGNCGSYSEVVGVDTVVRLAFFLSLRRCWHVYVHNCCMHTVLTQKPVLCTHITSSDLDITVV